MMSGQQDVYDKIHINPPLSPARADFSIVMGCTQEIGNRHSVCTLWFQQRRGDTQQLKEKTVILPPFGQPGRRFGSLSPREKGFVKRRWFLSGGVQSSFGSHAREYTAYTDKKEKEIFLIYEEIQLGSVAKPYMRKGFLIYEEMRK